MSQVNHESPSNSSTRLWAYNNKSVGPLLNRIDKRKDAKLALKDEIAES